MSQTQHKADVFYSGCDILPCQHPNFDAFNQAHFLLHAATTHDTCLQPLSVPVRRFRFHLHASVGAVLQP